MCDSFTYVQYFVEAPLAAITASLTLRWISSVQALHTWIWAVYPILHWQIL